MKSPRLLFSALGCAVLLCLCAGTSRAQGFSIDIFVHEDGTGSFTNSSGFTQSLPSFQLSDPGPGGLANALTFSLLDPPGLVAGDLFVLDPVTLQISDVIRFNSDQSLPDQSTGSLVFYSLADGNQLADIGLPASNYATTFTLTENVGGATLFTPVAGQPGFVDGAEGPVTYHIFSDEPNRVPDKGDSLVLLGLGFLALLPLRRVAQRLN